jgi:Arc/MetJ family transcription regulator
MSDTHESPSRVYRPRVRTNIEIDDRLMAEAMRAAGLDTKKATVDFALRELVRRRRRAAVSTLRGTVEWVGDLDESRS